MKHFLEISAFFKLSKNKTEIISPNREKRYKILFEVWQLTALYEILFD